VPIGEIKILHVLSSQFLRRAHVQTLAAKITADDAKAIIKHDMVKHVDVLTGEFGIKLRKLARPVGNFNIASTTRALDHPYYSVQIASLSMFLSPSYMRRQNHLPVGSSLHFHMCPYFF
jgi:hypothetical protein